MFLYCRCTLSDYFALGSRLNRLKYVNIDGIAAELDASLNRALVSNEEWCQCIGLKKCLK